LQVTRAAAAQPNSQLHAADHVLGLAVAAPVPVNDGGYLLLTLLPEQLHKRV
jgi:hypothetical protein